MLEDCPICDLIRKELFCSSGEQCVLVNRNGNLSVVLKEHISVPSKEAFKEVYTLLGDRMNHGLLKENRDVAGHWGVSYMPAAWASEGKSKAEK